MDPKAADLTASYQAIKVDDANKELAPYNMAESPSMANLRNSEAHFDEGIEMNNKDYMSNKKPFVAVKS